MRKCYFPNLICVVCISRTAIGWWMWNELNYVGIRVQNDVSVIALAGEIAKFCLGSCIKFTGIYKGLIYFQPLICIHLIHKTFALMHQWLTTGNVCTLSHIMQISLHTRERIWFWNIQLISTRWNFFGKPCGWCWCQCVDMWLSQWLSVACWIDAIGRPEVTTETTRLSTNISLGNLMS